jgi:hypothetical protein
MNSRDKISKAAWNLIETSKDSAFRNLVNARQGGHLVIDQITLEKILQIVSSSLGEGFNLGHSSFMKVIDEEVNAIKSKKSK